MNPFYTASGAPGFHQSGQSAAIKAEFAAIQAAFDAVNDAGLDVDLSAYLTSAAAASTYLTQTAAAAAYLTKTGGTSLSIGSIVASAGITAASFSGPLNGNVNGNVSGSSGSCTGNAATATTATNATNAGTAASCSGNAASASAVPWTGVTGRPTALSSFTNDVGYVTSVGAAAAGALTGTTLAANVVASSLTSVGTLANLTVTNPINGSVTGNAGSVQGYGPNTGVAPNSLALRDGSGYLYANYINSTDGGPGGAVTSIMVKAGDNFLRSSPAASVAAFLSGQAMNINGSSTSCTGNAATASGISNGSSNGYGTRYVNPGSPSGGSDGDIWYQV